MSIPFNLSKLTDDELQRLFEAITSEQQKRLDESDLKRGTFIRINQLQVQIEMLDIGSKPIKDLITHHKGYLGSGYKDNLISINFTCEKYLDDFMDQQDIFLEEIAKL